MTNSATDREEAVLLLHAYHDGELDPANALALERRLAADPALAAESRRIGSLRRALREKIPREAAPAALRMRIERTLGLGRAQSRPSLRALAASVVLAAALSSSATWLALQPTPGDAAAEAVVGGHLRALAAPQPIDVSSSDRHTVKPWFNGRVPQAPRVVDLTYEGFPLVGGRIDVIGRTPVPTLVYRHRQHLISLTAVPAAGAAAPPEQRTVQGYNLLGWTADGVTYWAISDLGAGDLHKFADLFRAAPPDG